MIEVQPGIIARINKSDGKRVEICQTRAAWEERREQVGQDADFLCSHCDRPAPLHDEELENEEGAMPSIIRAGHADHVNNRKMGGGSRDDSRSNLRWLCWLCHHHVTIGKLVIA